MSKVPSWLRNAVFYQIYPQSYYDSNSDGIGDIPGIVEKLDYIQSLGANALWVNPCFVSPFRDAGYDVADFYKVAPRYGTNAELKRLFREAHRRNIRVCLDLVAGHTSIDHPWFKASCQHKRNVYSDRYIWTNSAWDHGEGSLKFINGYGERNGNYAINFFYSQPALNYGFANPKPNSWQQPRDAAGPTATRRELKKIISFWLGIGADGFRVDMASSLVKNDPDRKATIALWQEVRQWLQKSYPEAILLSEWSNPTEAISAGFHIDFMLHFGVPGYASLFFNEKGIAKGGKCFFDSRGKGDVCEFLDSYHRQYRKTRRKGYISIPSGNHDIQRLNSGRNQDDLKVIFTFLLTWPGVPFIYYGDEIGMRFIQGLPSKEGGYDRTGARTPMQWTKGRNAGFSSASEDQLYLPIDPHKNRPTVEVQNTSSSSLLSHVRKLIALRKRTPALQADGDLDILYAKPNSYPFVYLRQHGKDTFIIALNPSMEEISVRFNLKDLHKPTRLLGRGVLLQAKIDRIQLSMKGVSYGIFRG